MYRAGRADLPLASPPGSLGIHDSTADAADLGSTAASRQGGGGGHRCLTGSLHETALGGDTVSLRAHHVGGETGEVLAECGGKPSRSRWVNWWINPPDSVDELSLSWVSSTIWLQPIGCHPFWTLCLVTGTQQGDTPEIGSFAQHVAAEASQLISIFLQKPSWAQNYRGTNCSGQHLWQLLAFHRRRMAALVTLTCSSDDHN